MTRALLSLALAAAACATPATNLRPLTRSAPLEEDERAVWRQCEKEEKRVEKAGVLYPDEALQAYLESITRRLADASGAGDFHFQVRVVKSVYLNAFTLPNGFIYVHSGLLAQMDDEAQLATLLAHEMTHATHRHAIRERRDLQNKLAFGSTMDAILPGLGRLAAFSSVRGYSREMETEADEEGFRRIAAAGYELNEAPKIFQKLIEEKRETGREEPFFFGTHPALAERIANYQQLIRQYAGKEAGDVRRDEFLAHTRDLLYENARLDLQAGRFQSAARGAEKYRSLDPAAARGPFLLGEIARQRRDPDAVESALAQYRRAVALDPAWAPPWRALGILLMKRGERTAARESLLKYLALSPTADDRGYVERDLELLR
jgi:predicted Zn-dependent protease